MTHSQLETDLVAEGKSFATKYSSFTEDKDFMAAIAKVFNEGELPPFLEQLDFGRDQDGTLTPVGAAKHFSIMHGYLNMAYISGFALDTDPEWADSRASSWARWVQYLRIVESYSLIQSRDFAKRFFYAVDSVHAYT